MKKRIISLLLVLSMLLCVLPAASADETVPNFTRYSISLNKSIAINFKVKLADIEGKNPSVTFEKGGETYGPYTTYGVDGDYAVFTFRNLSPDEMATPVTATLTTEAGTSEFTRSVKQYCMSMLGKNAATANLKKLIVDLLNYGAAFQTYKISKDLLPADTTLVNEDLTDDQKALGTQGDPDLTNNDFVDETNDAIEGAGVSLEDSVVLYFIPGEGVSSVKVNDTAAEYDEKYGYFCYDKLNPAQMRDVVKVQAYDSNGNKVGGELSYSIVAYANDTNNDDAESAVLKALVKEMIKYGDSTATYVETPYVKTTWFNYHFTQFTDYNSIRWHWEDKSYGQDQNNYTIGVNDGKQLQLTLNPQRTTDVYARGCYGSNAQWAAQKVLVECSLINFNSGTPATFEYGVQLTNGNTPVFIVGVKNGVLCVNYTSTDVSVGLGSHKIQIESNPDNTFDVYMDGNLVKAGVGYYAGGSMTNIQVFAKGNSSDKELSVCFDDVNVYKLT